MAKPINVVIDLSDHQETADFAQIKSDGVVGVIHKANLTGELTPGEHSSRH